MTHLTHMLKERTAKDVTTRCGLTDRPDRLTTTAWERLVTCPECTLRPRAR